jgi:hypothetical protein
MLRAYIPIATALGAVAIATQVWAQPPDDRAPGRFARAFEGYWMGVDPLDGGDSRRSLVRRSDGRFVMAGRDTVLTLCDGTDRGFISFDDGAITARGTLETPRLTIACTNSGAAVVLLVRYQPISDGIIIEHTSTPAGAPVSRIVFHRIDGAPPGGSPQAPAATGRTPGFTGYWMGVDPVDGGDARRSIMRLPDGRFAMAARDSMMSLCDHTDQAFARFDDGELVGRDVMQSNSLHIQCFNN